MEISRKTKSAIKKQKEIRQAIICADCEYATQRYDHYASLVLTDRSPASPVFRSVRRRYETFRSGEEIAEYGHWENPDCSQFQKFVISVVLRTHFAGKLEGPLRLPANHVRGLLALYRTETAQDDLTYPIVVSEYSKSDNLRHHIVLPYINKREGHHFVELAGGGYIFNVYVSSHQKPCFVKNLCLKSDGSMFMVVISARETGLVKKSRELVRTVRLHSKTKQ